MKKHSVRLISFFLIIAACISVSSCGISANIYKFDFPDRYLVGAAETDSAGINSLSINWVAGDITIAVHDENKISFSETGAADSDSSLRYRIENGSITIQYCKAGLNLSLAKLKGKALTVYVPKSFGKLEINNVSADMIISDITLNRLSVNSVSGNMSFSNSAANEISIENVSGHFSFSDANVKDIEMETVSGDIDFGGTVDDFEAKCVSANLTLTSNICPSDINLEMISGNADIFLPEDSSFTAELNSASGNISSDFLASVSKDRIVCGNGSAQFDFETVSGNIRISKIS